jgi:hypothetical protein
MLRFLALRKPVERPEKRHLGLSLRGLLLALMQAWLIFVLGCGAQGPETLVMKFDVARKANGDMPVMVDVVVVYDEELKDELDRLTATEWFAQRDQRVRNNPGMQSFQTWRWELTPGKNMSGIKKTLRGLPAKGILFADYNSRGKHSATFDPNYAQTVQFRQDAFRVVVGEQVEPESSGWRPPVGWTAIGLGIVGLGLGTFFAIKKSNAQDDMKEYRQKDTDKYDELKDDYDSYKVGEIVSFSVGAALLLTGILILVWPTSNDDLFRNDIDSDDVSDGSTNPW